MRIPEVKARNSSIAGPMPSPESTTSRKNRYSHGRPGNGDDVGVCQEKVATLRQRNRMRRDAANLRERSARRGDQAVADAQLRFAHDMQRVRAEQIVVLVDGSGERVLDRHDPAGRVARFDGAEQVHESGAGYEMDRGTMRLEGGGVAERARLALDGDRLRHQ